MMPLEVWGITPDRWSMDTTRIAILTAFEDGVTHIVVRERSRPPEWRHALMTQLLESGVPRDHLLLRIGSEDPPPPSGWSVHLSTGVPQPAGYRPLVSAAAHSLTAIPANADRLLVSPFHSPRSKPDTRPPLGHRNLARFCAQAIPVIALGGVTPDNVTEARAAGAHGVAAISAVFGVPAVERRRLVQAARGAGSAKGLPPTR